MNRGDRCNERLKRRRAVARAEPRSADDKAQSRPAQRMRLAVLAARPHVRAGGRDPLFVLADAPHRRSQSRRPRRAAARLSLSQPVPRRPDRRAGAEPADARRDHRRGDRGLGHRRRPMRSPSIRKSCCSSRPAKATASPTKAGRRSNSRSIPNASARCCAGSCRRRAPAPASTTATAICCSIRAR